MIASAELNEWLLILNGFLAALLLMTVGGVVWGLWKVIQGRKLLQSINEVHNNLAASVSKVDQKVQEALLRIDHLTATRGKF